MTDSTKQKVDIVPAGYKIKAGGMFDFEEMYQELQRWFTYNGYTWQETKYRVVENPDGSKQVELKWVCPRKIDDYVTFVITMDLQVFHSDVEANIDGVKKKLQKGGYEFRFGSSYEKNWKEFWMDEKGQQFRPLMKWFKEFYEKVMVKGRLESYDALLYTESHMLFSEIKAYMQLYGSS